MKDFDNWLIEVKGRLLSTRMFNDDLTLHRKSWKQLYDDGYTPHQAIQIDFGYSARTSVLEGITTSIYWRTFLDEA